MYVFSKNKDQNAQRIIKSNYIQIDDIMQRQQW